MKRRTILAALAAAPMVFFANTAHAIGFRRRRSCNQQPVVCAPRDVDTPYLEITYEGGESGMEVYRVVVTVNVTAENTPNVVLENIREVKVSLLPDGGINDEPMMGSGNIYTFSASGVMLQANQNYRAKVTAYFDKEEYGQSNPVGAPPSP